MATVLTAKDPEVIKQTLYKTDETAKGRILPTYVETLTEADLAFYRERGYFAMDGLFTAEEVESYKAALADVIHGRTVADKKLYLQEEPYYQAGGAEDRPDDPELRVRKVFYF